MPSPKAPTPGNKIASANSIFCAVANACGGAPIWRKACNTEAKLLISRSTITIWLLIVAPETAAVAILAQTRGAPTLSPQIFGHTEARGQMVDHASRRYRE